MMNIQNSNCFAFSLNKVKNKNKKKI